MKHLKQLLPLALFLLLFALALTGTGFSQVTSGTISGTVMDTTGAVVSGATVTVRSDAIGFSRSVTTSDSGGFVFPALPPAT